MKKYNEIQLTKNRVKQSNNKNSSTLPRYIYNTKNTLHIKFVPLRLTCININNNMP